MIGAETSVASYVGPADDGPAPALPSEQHLVTAALALESARTSVVAALVLSQCCPRDETAMLDTMRSVYAAMDRAWHSYSAFNAVRSCAGQA